MAAISHLPRAFASSRAYGIGDQSEQSKIQSGWEGLDATSGLAVFLTVGKSADIAVAAKQVVNRIHLRPAAARTGQRFGRKLGPSMA